MVKLVLVLALVGRYLLYSQTSLHLLVTESFPNHNRVKARNWSGSIHETSTSSRHGFGWSIWSRWQDRHSSRRFRDTCEFLEFLWPYLVVVSRSRLRLQCHCLCIKGVFARFTKSSHTQKSLGFLLCWDAYLSPKPIRDLQSFDTVLNLVSDITGSLTRTSSTISLGYESLFFFCLFFFVWFPFLA